MVASAFDDMRSNDCRRSDGAARGAAASHHHILLNTLCTGGRTWLAVTNGREEGNARAKRPPKPEAGGPPESMKHDAIAGTAAAAPRVRSSVLEQQSFNILECPPFCFLKVSGGSRKSFSFKCLMNVCEIPKFDFFF